MNFTISHYKYGERPDVTKPHPDFFQHMKEEGIRKMVSRHYDLMRQTEIKNLFSTDDGEFEQQKQHSADFMVQICGGNDYYNQRRGKPMMINRHAASEITAQARLIWLQCYQQALSEIDNVPEHAIQSFWDYINIFSTWMINTPENNERIFRIK